MISIRPATVNDAEGIAHVHVRSWRTTYTGIIADAYLATLNEADRAQSWRAWMGQGVRVYVAEVEGEIYGFISGGAIRETLQNYDAELYAIYLLHGAHGRGTGTALLRQLAASLMAEGFRSMTVWVLEDNPARHFYARTGARQLPASKQVEIGGAALTEIAYGWPDLAVLGS